jgi:hypothetical protein
MLFGVAIRSQFEREIASVVSLPRNDSVVLFGFKKNLCKLCAFVVKK